MLPHLAIQRCIVYFWLRIEVWLEHLDYVESHETRQRAISLLNLTEDSRLGRTNFDTRRLKAPHDPVIAESALLGSLGFRVEEPGSVRTGLNAISATDAVIAVDKDYTILRFESGPDRTYLNTWWIVTVIAQLGNEERAYYLSFVDSWGESIYSPVWAIDD